VKVGKEIRALKKINNTIISSVAAVGDSLRARRYGFFKAVFLGAIFVNIVFLPINVSLSVTQAAVDTSDPDPVHRAQAAAEARGEVYDPDPVHQAQKATQAQATSAIPTASASEPYDPDPVHQAQKAAQAQAAIIQPTPAATSTQSTAQAAPVAPVLTASNTADPLSGLNLYVNNYSSAKAQANAWSGWRQVDADKMNYLAAQPTAVWFGNWNSDVQGDVANVVSAAQKSGATPVLVAYNIPARDCGGYSSGGTSQNTYTNWIGAFARGIGSASAIVILEPDALAGISCLSASDQKVRTDLISSAVSILKSNSNTKVYIDAGHSGWVDAATMAARLQAAGIVRADGFSLNVSNFNSTSAESDYGQQISQALGGKHFVIDTSRNGNGSSGEWCNPWGRAAGSKPTVNTGNNLVDAYLWVKTPGESDGNCNGGPSAGTWWPDYALSLVK
jgi:endoglucanase